MSFKIDLQQLLDIALATPEIGNVNFNVLRAFLLEILKHLGIRRKSISISDDEDFRVAFELIRDGFVIPQTATGSHSELDLMVIDEHVIFEETGRRSATPALQRSTVSQEEMTLAESASRRSKSASPRLSQGTMPPPSPRLSHGKSPPVPYEESLGSRGSSSGKKSTAGGISLTVTPAESPTNNRSPDFAPSKMSAESSRRSIEIIHRGETLKSLTRKISELQARVDVLEASKLSQPVKSTASFFIHSDSKTPAKDMKELINIEQKLQACETTIQGLAEIIDILTSDMGKIREDVHVDGILLDVDNLKGLVGDLKTKSEANQSEVMTKMEEMKNDLKQIVEDAQFKPPTRKLSLDVSHIERVVDRKLQHEISQLAQKFAQGSNEDSSGIMIASEAPKEMYEALDKIDDLFDLQQSLEEQIKNISENLESIRDLIQEQKVLKDKVEQSYSIAEQASSTAKRLDADSKQVNVLIDENKHQTVQINNSLMELQEKSEEMSSTLQGIVASSFFLRVLEKGRHHCL
jgi:hypothetical protein